MSSGTGDDRQIGEHVRSRLENGLRRIAYFVVPSAAAFVLLGDVIVKAIYQSGRFTAGNTRFTWAILAAAAVGLLASTLGRLYSSAFYALHDTRTPLRFALIRVTLASIAGYFFALHLPRLIGLAPEWGAALLTLSSGVVGWVEFTLLRRRLNARIGRTALHFRFVGTLWLAAALAGAAGIGAKLLLASAHRFILAGIVLGLYGVLYFGLTMLLGIPEARGVLARVRRRGTGTTNGAGGGAARG
jgi:putative peptidoglycan lipid II flippase